jgi:hypothetical protein
MSAARRQRRSPSAPSAIDRMVVRVGTGNALCLLCGTRASNVGIWRPDPVTRRLFNTSSPIRIVYPLCSSCVALPNPATEIEDRILADVAAWQ